MLSCAGSQAQGPAGICPLPPAQVRQKADACLQRSPASREEWEGRAVTQDPAAPGGAAPSSQSLCLPRVLLEAPQHFRALAPVSRSLRSQTPSRRWHSQTVHCGVRVSGLGWTGLASKMPEAVTYGFLGAPPWAWASNPGAVRVTYSTCTSPAWPSGVATAHTLPKCHKCHFLWRRRPLRARPLHPSFRQCLPRGRL